MTRARLAMGVVTLTCLLLGAVAPMPVAGADTYERLPAIVHVHSDLTSGEFPLEELTDMAERQGLGAVLLTENYLNRVEYSLPPFRALTRVTYEARSVHGRLDEYFTRVAQARAARPRVLVLPGVEVMPHYFWSGSPFSLALTLHDTQKNLLVWGLDRSALAALPVIGNAAAGTAGLQTLLDVLPVILVVPGVVLLARPRTQRRTLGRAGVVVERRRAWLPGLVLCALAATAIVRAWPFTQPVHPAWAEAGSAPYQDLIDYVDRAGGVSVWSLPEASDFGQQAVGPVQVSWTTEPYPDDLLKTFGYTAFGAIYEDTTRVERPGEAWDRLLMEYAAGQRTRVPWALAESAFHENSAGKRVGPVQTVFLVRERTEAGVLEALRAGRMYAMQRTRDAGFALTEFTAVAGERAAISGQTLRTAPGVPLEVTVALAALDPRPVDVRVTLIRNGSIVAAWSGATPLRATHRETWDGRPAVFRLEARGSGGRLLSNPVFVRAS